jgi:hypothetical protein
VTRLVPRGQIVLCIHLRIQVQTVLIALARFRPVGLDHLKVTLKVTMVFLLVF